MARRVVLPESKIRRRRRILRTRLAMLCGVLFLLLLGLAIGLSWIPYLRIKTMHSVGTETLASTTVEEFVAKKIEGRSLFVLPRDNIVLYPKHEIEKGLLKEFPILKEAEIHADNLEAIRIEVQERHAKALWCGASSDETEGCRLMDETGFVYSPILAGELPPFVRYTGAATTSPGFTSQTEPKQFVTPKEFLTLEALVDALNQNQKQTPIVSVSVDEHYDARITFGEGFVLLFALKDAGKDVYERFTLALASTPFLNKTINDFEYLDLRFGDKLYFKQR